MAEKATALPSHDKFSAPGIGAAGDKAEIERLSSAAAAANERKAKAERKSNVPDEVYIRYWDAITVADAAVRELEKRLKQAKGVRSSCYSTAKSDGCNIEAMKILRKMERIDIDELDTDMKMVARIAGLVESPIAETCLMKLVEDVDKVNYYTQGFTAGKAGDAAETNPHTPGTEPFEKWAKGWVDGQAKLAQDAFGKKPKKQKASKKNGQTVN